MNQNRVSIVNEKERVASEAAFDFKAYFSKVETMNKILEESFLKEREKCLTVVEIEDRPNITNSNINDLIDMNQNIHYKVKFILIFLNIFFGLFCDNNYETLFLFEFFTFNLLFSVIIII